MKPNEDISNIDEHNKTNSVFSRIFLVPRTSSMLFDEVKGYVHILSMTVESMIRGYHDNISKLLLESELDILKYCNINILTSICMQNKVHLTLLCLPHVTKQENWWNFFWQIGSNLLNSPNFFTTKVFPYGNVFSGD